VTSATRGVTRPPSRELFLIRDDERVRRDGRVEVGLGALRTVSIDARRNQRFQFNTICMRSFEIV
jgi:hypothetical protein